MYVVRIVRDEDLPADHKVFDSLHDAKKRYLSAARRVSDDEWKSVAVFRTDNLTDAREAVEAVMAGDNSKVELIELHEDLETWAAKAVLKLDI